MENDEVLSAQKLWNSGHALAGGAILCEMIPIAQRPHWAARILDLCRSLTQQVREVDAIYDLATHPSRWKCGHDAFRAVRELTLEYEKTKNTDEVYGGLLYLAENVAKVAYNATNPPGPFDDDAGAWIIACLRHLVDKVNTREFEALAWSLASRNK